MSELVKNVRHEDVYITPNYMVFNEAIEGVSYQQRITIKNIGNKTALIRIHQANSMAFQVKTLKSTTHLSPGLSITVCVIYTFKRPSVLHAIIPIEVNGKIFDYRVICTLAVEGIDVEPKSIDFGVIDIGYSGLKVITIFNKGGKSTKFSIDRGQNDLFITVEPCQGIVRPRKEVKLRIELISMSEGVFYSEFWIKSVPNIRVPIKVNIITPRLVVYHPNTTGDYTLINFSPTIEKSSRYDTFVLRNLSSRISRYVVLGELNNEVKCIQDIDRKRYPTYAVFKICPIAGVLEPFQSIIFKLKFSPTIKLSPWQRKQKQRIKLEDGCQDEDNENFIAFIRIIRVQCESGNIIRETTTEISSLSASCSSIAVSESDANSNDNVTRICLYGEVEAMRLFIEPDTLYFGDLLVGQISQRVFRLTNPSTFTPIYLEYVPNGAARCYPNLICLKSKMSIEVLVKVRGKESIQPSFQLFFDLKVDSYNSTSLRGRTEKIKIGSYSVLCTVNIILKSKQGLLSKRSLSIVATNNDENIIKRILQLPKWRYHSATTEKFVECIKISTLKKSIFTNNAAVLIPLLPLQIYNIHVHPIPTLAFGVVASNSSNFRQLIARNKNDIPVMIRLISTSTEYITFPEGDTMILQPDSTMTRIVEYRANNIGKFNGRVKYVINNNHFFDFNVTAEIVHKQLHMHEEEIVLGRQWSSEEAYRPLASVVRITNKLDAKTCFRWEVPAESGFHVEPMSGTVRGNSTLHAYVYYKPDNAKTNHGQVRMRCESGSCSLLRLSVPRFTPKVEFLNNDTNLGEIPFNLPTKVIAVLQNHDFNDVTYEVDGASLTRGCSVNPRCGKIPPRGIAILEIYLTLDVCCQFSIMIAVIIQRSTRLLYKVNGAVSFPNLKITPRRINMKRIRIGASQVHRITVTNTGATMLKLQFLLEDYPEFRVSLLENGTAWNVGTNGIVIVPGQTQSFYLHFQPVDLASYAFYLPMIVNELLGPMLMSNAKSVGLPEFLKSRASYYAKLSNFVMAPLPDKLPTVIIDCTVAARIVVFSKLQFRFNVATNEVSEELRIENRLTQGKTAMSINIEGFNQVDCPFTIEWSRGTEVGRTPHSIECTLHPGDSVYFIMEFKPKKRGSFSVEAPIRVHGELDGAMFNKLRLDGEFPVSAIDVEPTEIYFTPVSLGTPIEAKFMIRARYFDSAVLVQPNFAKVSRYTGNYKNELLHVEFPNGNVVPPHSCVALEGKVTFESNQPVSFCSTIEFGDDQAAAVCSLTVYATADNNLLTIYKYEMRSPVWDNTSATTKSLEKCVSTSPLISLNNETNGDDCNDCERSRTCDHADEKGGSPRRKDSAHFETKNCERTARSSRSHYLTDDREKDYEKYISEIMITLEEWMYSGPLEFQFYPSILHGITAAFSNYYVKKKSSVGNPKWKSKTTIPSFIDVLQSLVGSKIHDCLRELLRQPLPENNIERVKYVLQLYNETLDFLLCHGAHLAHVSAQFLLNYDDYLISIGIMWSNIQKKSCGIVEQSQCEQLSQQLFESRSKQCWMDVILQTYKCFVLAGIHECKYRTLPSFGSHSSRKTIHQESVLISTSSLQKQYDLHERAAQNITNLLNDKSIIKSDRCAEENFLLAWLRYHYEEQRKEDWMTDRRVILNPQEKQDVTEFCPMQNFHSDLSNSLVLIAVTAAYCPFLIREYLGNLFICPRNKEEMFHNAICLVDAWRKIRLGFIITPEQIVSPNRIQMLMLVVHLFNALPTYVFCAKVKLSCSLTQTTTKRITVSNPMDNTVHYLLTFVSNANGFFTIPNSASSLRLKARGSGQVQIQFHAKKIRNKKTYLLLCGHTLAPYFGRNQCIILEGGINKIGIVNEYTVQSKLYEILDTSLRIDIPYRNAAKYYIWITEKHPNDPSVLEMTQSRNLRTKKIPKRIFLNQKWMIVAEGASEAHLSISVACIVPKQRKFWFIFQAKTGDFVIQINSTWQTSIHDHIVIKWAIQAECICSNQRGGIKDFCPFNINVPIPSRNIQLWKCITEMFKKTLDEREYQFWFKYLDTRIGLHLIRWLIEHNTDLPVTVSEFAHIFDTTVTYKISLSDKSSPLVVPECFTIQDVRLLNEQVLMTIHISPTTPSFYETIMSLASASGKELRVYVLNCLQS